MTSPVLIDRQTAIETGVSHYFTGRPCANGHVGLRRVSTRQCLECSAQNTRKSVSANREAVCARRRELHAARSQEINARERERKRLNRDDLNRRAREKWPERRAQQMSAKRERYAADPLYALKTTVRNSVGTAFRVHGFTKGARAAALVGCDWPTLKQHIERQFAKGMNWANRGIAWHIDHIVPLASAETKEDVAALCHFTNLRPLWAAENNKKYAHRTHLI